MRIRLAVIAISSIVLSSAASRAEWSGRIAEEGGLPRVKNTEIPVSARSARVDPAEPLALIVQRRETGAICAMEGVSCACTAV